MNPRPRGAATGMLRLKIGLLGWALLILVGTCGRSCLNAHGSASCAEGLCAPSWTQLSDGRLDLHADEAYGWNRV